LNSGLFKLSPPKGKIWPMLQTLALGAEGGGVDRVSRWYTYLLTNNANLVYLGKALECKDNLCMYIFITLSYILCSCGIILWPFGIVLPFRFGVPRGGGCVIPEVRGVDKYTSRKVTGRVDRGLGVNIVPT
jgi:hypothetical protein